MSTIPPRHFDSLVLERAPCGNQRKASWDWNFVWRQNRYQILPIITYSSSTVCNLVKYNIDNCSTTIQASNETKIQLCPRKNAMLFDHPRPHPPALIREACFTNRCVGRCFYRCSRKCTTIIKRRAKV
jgi:hypothetical protein